MQYSKILDSFSDYPFGMLMPGRIDSAENYRFGFNGQERSDNIKGIGKHNTALFWEYDTRLGRRLNLDPKPNTFESNYSVLGNNPLWMTDRFGDKWKNDKDVKSKDDLINDMAKKAEVYGSKVDEYIQNLDLAEKNGDKKGAEKFENLAEQAINGRSEMLEGIKELNKMTDDQMITFTFNDKGQSNPSKNDVVNLEWSGDGWANNDPSKERLIIINHFSRTGNGYKTNGNKVHEIHHAYDVLMKNMVPFTTGVNIDFKFGIGGNFKSERDSYIRQFYYDKGSMPGQIENTKEIDRSYLIELGYKLN